MLDMRYCGTFRSVSVRRFQGRYQGIMAFVGRRAVALVRARPEKPEVDQALRLVSQRFQKIIEPDMSGGGCDGAVEITVGGNECDLLFGCELADVSDQHAGNAPNQRCE